MKKQKTIHTNWHTGHIFNDMKAGFKFTTHLHSHYFTAEEILGYIHIDPPEH